MAENYPIVVHAGGMYADPPKAELRTLENPSTPLSAPDDWLYDALGSYRASSGVNVNSQTALTYPPFWRGVNLISGDVGRLPLYYYRRLKRGREQAQDQSLFRLLRYKPNSEMTAFVFRKTLQAHVLVQGNGYAYISRSGSGRPLELIPLNPTQCYPIRKNGQLWYVLDIPDVEMRKIRPEDILHLKGLSHDGLLGYSVMAKARESLGLAMALQTYAAVFFRNNARPNLALEYPDGMRPEAVQTMRENWERLHSGLENAHKVALLKAGVKLHTYGVNARDAMLIEAAKLSVRDTANILSIPPHKLGDDSKSGYNSLEQENQSYLDEGLDPHLVTWEEEIWSKLLTDREKEQYFAEFDRRALLRANLQARGAYYKDAVAGGWMSDNEVREEEGMNPREDPDGDKYARPQYGYAGDPAPAGQPGTPPPPAPAAPAPAAKPPKKKKQASARLLEIHRQLLIDAAARMGKRLAVHGRKAAKKPEDFARFLAELEADHAATMAEVLGPPLRAAGLVIGRAVNVKQFVAETIEAFRRDLAECQAKNTPVDQTFTIYENSWPYILANAFMALDERAKPDKPSRTTDQALDILSRLPDVEGKEGEVSLTMPATDQPPYKLDIEKLKDAKKKVVKIRKLIGTRATLKRKRVADFIKNPEAYTKGRLLDALPTDRPYICRYQGKLYIHDGHHRLMARQLLATVKTKVYYYEVD